MEVSLLSDEMQTEITTFLTNLCATAVDKSLELNNAKTRYLKEVDALFYCGNISRNTLKKWVNQGLPFSKISGVILYDKKDLDTFITKYKC